MSQKGILWAASKIKNTDSVSPATYGKWYNEVHVPDVLKTSQIHSAFRYKNIDPSSERPYLALYPVGDTNFVDSKEFAEIPVTSDLFPGGRSVYEFADMDARFYDPVQYFEREGAPAGMLFLKSLLDQLLTLSRTSQSCYLGSPRPSGRNG